MSKQLKIDNEVYNDLTAAKWPGETYSHAIARLLDVRRLLMGAEEKLDAGAAVKAVMTRGQHARETTN